MGLRRMGPSDASVAAHLLADSMAWSESMVESTFALGRTVVSEVMSVRTEIVGVVHLVAGMPGIPDDVVLLRLAVASGSRQRGLGRILWERVLETLPRDVTVSSRTSATDAYSLVVGEHWGFRPVGTTLFQRRELNHDAVTTPSSVPGVTFEIVRGRLVGGLDKRMRSVMATAGIPEVELATYADSDVPDGSNWAEPTMSLVAAQPGDVIAVLAVEGGVDIGYTLAFVDEPGWHIADTAVVPSWRRRGVASWVKGELAQLAVREGVPWMTTHNDAANGPILALNDANGFRTSTRAVSLRRTP